MTYLHEEGQLIPFTDPMWLFKQLCKLRQDTYELEDRVGDIE
jgi:hypothetical protein